MLPRAVTNLVAYVSGTAFYADGQGHDHMRLSFCYPAEAPTEEGVSASPPWSKASWKLFRCSALRIV